MNNLKTLWKKYWFGWTLFKVSFLDWQNLMFDDVPITNKYYIEINNFYRGHFFMYLGYFDQSLYNMEAVYE
jgi:hypothetical protein